MIIEKTRLEGVVVITPKRHSDDRGFFSETWSEKAFHDAGLDYAWVQDNHSLSTHTPTIRGLHCQSPDKAQAKLVRCGQGRLFDVCVDIRRQSSTYGQWVGYELSADNGKQLLIPEGFLHGFASLESNTEIIYKCSDFYSAANELSVRYDDADLNIDWAVDLAKVQVSEKDLTAISFDKFQSPF